MYFSKEQIYIVTGASSGIGEATAKMLNAEGASVIAVARNKERLEKMKQACKYPENVHLEIKDLTEDIEGLPDYVKSLKEKYGKFSGLAYCAGVSAVYPLQNVDYDYNTAVNTFKINYFAPLFITKGLVDRRNNIGKGCSLVFLSSLGAVINLKGQSIYSGSKAALSASMTSISHEVSRQGIRINCLLPSMIKTPMTERCIESGFDVADEISPLYPFGWGEPDDVANMAVYLLSDKSKFISGQNYVIDSGGVSGGG